jgi:CheY-like chemotaxis protein
MAAAPEHKDWIVIVDDDEDGLALSVWGLHAAGYAVAGFTNGAAALKFIADHRDHVIGVITDLSLPVLDGLTVAEEIRKNEQALGTDPVPIAFFTAHEQSPGGATERVAKKSHVDRIWHKPKDTEHLPDLVRGWLSAKGGKIQIAGEIH